MIRRGLAVYKTDGTPWTRQELIKVGHACGSPVFSEDKDKLLSSDVASRTYVYDYNPDSTKSKPDRFMHLWTKQDVTPMHIQISYSELCGRKLKTYQMQ